MSITGGLDPACLTSSRMTSGSSSDKSNGLGGTKNELLSKDLMRQADHDLGEDGHDGGRVEEHGPPVHSALRDIGAYEYDAVMARQLPTHARLSNQWADLFAKAGAQQHRVDARRVEQFTDYVTRMLARAKFMARARPRISASGRWDDRDSDGANIKMAKSVSDIKQHAVVFEQHAYAHLPKGGAICLRCKLLAVTEKAKAPAAGEAMSAFPAGEAEGSNSDSAGAGPADDERHLVGTHDVPGSGDCDAGSRPCGCAGHRSPAKRRCRCRWHSNGASTH